MLRTTLVLNLALIALLFTAPEAYAEPSAALLACAFEGDVAAPERDTLEATLERALDTESAPLLDLDAARGRLSTMAPEVLDCFDVTCLKRVAQALELERGYAFTIARTRAGYEITGATYALRSGRKIKSAFLPCDGCTASQAQDTLRSVARSVLSQGATSGGGADSTGAPRQQDGSANGGGSGAPQRGVQTPEVAIFANPVDTRIIVNGEPVGVGRFEGELGSGVHVVRLEREGFRTVEERVTVLDDASTTYLVVHMRPVQDPGPVMGRSGGLMDRVDQQALAWGLTAGGGAALIAGVALLAIDGDLTCDGPPQSCPDRIETTAGGVALSVLGGVALTGGVITFLWDELAGTPVEDVGLELSPQRAMVWWETRF